MEVQLNGAIFHFSWMELYLNSVVCSSMYISHMLVSSWGAWQYYRCKQLYPWLRTHTDCHWMWIDKEPIITLYTIADPGTHTHTHTHTHQILVDSKYPITALQPMALAWDRTSFLTSCHHTSLVSGSSGVREGGEKSHWDLILVMFGSAQTWIVDLVQQFDWSGWHYSSDVSQCTRRKGAQRVEWKLLWEVEKWVWLCFVLQWSTTMWLGGKSRH